MEVEVVRSHRRRKTVQLRPTATGVRISIPSNATAAEEQEYVRSLLRQYERRQRRNAVDLQGRAKRLADKYRLQHPTTIEWSENQTTRWGSCTPDTGAIRISSAVSKFPSWVIDYVIVHELAHLSYFGHGPRFWQLVERYPKTERARGFLIAKGWDSEDDSDSHDASEDDVDAKETTEPIEPMPRSTSPTPKPRYVASSQYEPMSLFGFRE